MLNKAGLRTELSTIKLFSATKADNFDQDKSAPNRYFSTRLARKPRSALLLDIFLTDGVMQDLRRCYTPLYALKRRSRK
jgi:hypothetical protein